MRPLLLLLSVLYITWQHNELCQDLIQSLWPLEHYIFHTSVIDMRKILTKKYACVLSNGQLLRIASIFSANCVIICTHIVYCNLITISASLEGKNLKLGGRQSEYFCTSPTDYSHLTLPQIAVEFFNCMFIQISGV